MLKQDKKTKYLPAIKYQTMMNGAIYCEQRYALRMRV